MLALQGLLMMLLPVAVILLVRRRRPLPWGALGLGAGMFLLAQALKAAVAVPITLQKLIDPFSWAMVFFGAALPGFFEEITKWVPLKLMKRKQWDAVLAFGLGFGGVESLYLGLTYGTIGLVTLLAPQSLPPEVLSQYAGGTGLLAVLGLLLGLLERVAGMAIHLGLTVLNARSLQPGRWYYLLLAMFLHFAVDLFAGYYQFFLKPNGGNVYGIEVVVVGAGLLAFWYARRTLKLGTGPLEGAAAD